MVLLIGIHLLGPCNLHAWLWGKSTLVTINGEAFTKEDFQHWWDNWKEKDTPFPESLKSFIDWHLLAQEADSMELYQEPAYRHKVDTFLKVRALMILKNEAVDSKIKISDRDLWNQYKEQYSPRMYVRFLHFDQEIQARQICEKLNSGKPDMTVMTEQDLIDKGIVNQEDKWLRPRNCVDSWRDALAGLGTGQVTRPLEMGKGFVCLCLLEQNGPDKSDFQSFKFNIRRKIKKLRQSELTSELVRRLRKKYEVTVDEDLFAELDMNNTSEELMDKILITTNRVNVPVRVFLDQLREEQNLRGYHNFQTKEAADYLKKMVLNLMISQTLTTWESLDRHYEERPPFKWVNRFYCQRRLIKELEKRLFLPNVDVSDEEVAAYYEQHPDEFGKPGVVSIAVLEDDKKLADKIWGEVKQGKNFYGVVRKYYSRDIPVQRVPVNHLVPAMKEVVEKLTEGEVSPPFEVNGHSSMVKLMDRTVTEPIPLSEVQEQIVQHLREEKIGRLQEDFIEQLRARSSITVNNKAWRDIKDEYGSKGVGNDN